MDSFEREAILEFQEAGWETTIRTLWPGLFPYEFADFHRRSWQWASEVMPGEPSQDRIQIWSRGTGKSSTAEGMCAYWGIMRRRRYIWYVSSTQQNADDHITTVGDLLTAQAVQKYFPSIANRKVDVVGTREAWRRNRLITDDGFAVDAVGMDTTVRGRKLGDQRPDAIIFDDLDDKFDTPDNTAKKIEAIASSIIAAGTPHTVIVGAQNLITPTGIFAKFADGTNTILQDSVVDGPIPAVFDLKTDGNTIIGGRPSWPEGMSLDKCQNLINQMGLATFLLENQHDIHQVAGSLWTRDMIHYSDLPGQIDEYNIGIDPAMSDGPRSDLTGIYVAALSGDKIYLVDEFSGRHHPSKTKQLAVDLWHKYQCEVHIETDNGGAWLIQALIDAGVPKHMVVEEKSRGVSKRGRAQPLADKAKIDSQENLLFHCKKFETLENQMVSWVPSDNAKSPDHLDAAVWATAKWLKPRVRSARGYGYAFT